MCDTCDDNRFELIKKYRQKLLDATNIEDSPEEMAVIDNVLFRLWQIGWLEKLEQFGNSELLSSSCGHEKDHVADPGKMVGDSVSRQAVIDAIESVDWYHINKSGEMVHGANDNDHQAWYKAEDIYKAVENVPSAQRWVLATPETTPDSYETVYVTVSIEKRRYVTRGVVANGKWVGIFGGGRVVAWTPITYPEPYNGELDG